MMFGSFEPKLPEYPPMFTSTVVSDVAILTLLAGGGFVLGIPRGARDEDRAMAIDAIKAYLAGEHGWIVLPWPCDVDDQRERAR